MSFKSFIENQEKNSQLLLSNSDLLLENKFQFLHPYDMEPCEEIVSFSEKIKWTHVPFGDEEWSFMLNRQEYLMDLCLSFENDRQMIYLEKGKSLILEWIENNTDSSDWRSIDTGIRLVYWKIMLDYLIKEKQLTALELKQIEVSVKEQLIYLDSLYIEKYDLSNWGILITSGFFIIQLLFDECSTEEMNRRMLSRLEKQLYLQIQPLGNHWEQSPLYFMEVLRSLVFLHVSKAISDKKIHQQLEETNFSMYEFMPHFISPEKTTILQGDTDEMEIDDMVQTIALLYNRSIPTLFTERVAIDYATIHLSGKQVRYEHWQNGINHLKDNEFKRKMSDDDTGNYYYRSDWSKESDFFHLYNGSLGSGHGHLSLGHVDLSMNGINLFVDSGRFTYVESVIRKSLKEGTHHNTVIINDRSFGVVKDSWGYEKVPTSLANRMVETREYVVVRTMYIDQQDESIFKVVRTLLYLKEEKAFLIIDQAIDLFNNQFQKMQRQFHLSPGIEAEINGNSLLLKKKQNFSIHAFFSEEDLKILETEYSPRYNQLSTSKKIQTTSQSAHHFVYLSPNESVEVKEIRARKSDNQPVVQEKSFGVEIKMNRKKYLIHSAVEDTFEGHKLYVLDGHPVYGQLSIHKIEDGKSDYSRLL